MDITGFASFAMSSVTGLMSQLNSTAYIFIVFLLLIGVIAVVSKIFNMVLKVISVAVISALFPFIINMFTSSLFGAPLFNITSGLIMMSIVLGVSGLAVYKVVDFVLGIVESVWHIGTHGLNKHHHKQQKHHEKEGKREHRKEKEAEGEKEYVYLNSKDDE